MKKPLSLGALPSVLVFALGIWTGGCSSDPSVDVLPPSTEASGPGTPAAVGPDTPDTSGVLAAPGEETPASTPPVNDGPGATETNFLTPPCGGDSSRERPDAGDAGNADRPAPDATDAPDASVDAGPNAVRCVAPARP